jgi:aminopeptidase N
VSTLVKYLKDYQKPNFSIETIDLEFWLDSSDTKVVSTIKLHNDVTENSTLVLNAESLIIDSVYIDSQSVEYTHEDDLLTISNLPDQCILTITNRIDPQANSALDGLYKSGSIFCTQNEPEGFRRITPYLDRPDVMAKFTTKIIADKKTYPILLSNGNKIDSGDLADGKHFVTWEDPFKKPAYLYALVAGDLGLVGDTFTTMSGRRIALEIYCDKGDESKCEHAMVSLQRAMKWDEERFGREYDLDIYMIVSVHSFNMGAMENKGLNIFNSALVLADSDTASDANFMAIESVIGHEYFHNWTGNRITCRDWFQLTLKEGLTVFRDQEFSSDLNDRTVQRIADVNALRERQFAEDAGPTSHPIKPDSYMEINNFYTSTIYEKGAEVIRMLHTLLGEDGFRSGMNRYFELYDGQAVTTQEFIFAMSDANKVDLSQFESRWYSQNGTPRVAVSSQFENNTLSLTIEQHPAVKNQGAFYFPFEIGLINSDGHDEKLVLENCENQPFINRGILIISQLTETFKFCELQAKPTLSLNRGFSAPIILDTQLSNSELSFLMSHDSDSFNRYEAGLNYSKNVLLKMIHEIKEHEEINIDEVFIKSFGTLINDTKLSPAIKAMMLSLPSGGVLTQSLEEIEIEIVYEARDALSYSLAVAHKEALLSAYTLLNTNEAYNIEGDAIAKRALKNALLSLLMKTNDPEVIKICENAYSRANNMNDRFAALSMLSHCSNADEALETFYERYKENTLVMNKYFATIASSSKVDTLQKVIEAQSCEKYDKTVPNLVRSLLAAFGRNLKLFHAKDGSGYRFIADKILELDMINPQMAAGLCGMFKLYKKMNGQNQVVIKKELTRIIETKNLSKNSYEIIEKVLG